MTNLNEPHPDYINNNTNEEKTTKKQIKELKDKFEKFDKFLKENPDFEETIGKSDKKQ